MQDTTSNKTRKPYPTIDQRIAKAEDKIKEIEALIAHKEELIAIAEKKVNERKEALAKNQEELEAAKNKLLQLQEKKNKPKPVKAPAISAEERKAQRVAAVAKAREVRKAKKAELDALMTAIAESGKSMDEILESLKN